MLRLIILCMALLGWGSVALGCVGAIPEHAETLVAYAPLLAIPQLVTFYDSWGKDKKKLSILVRLALIGLFVGGVLLCLLCLLPFSVWSDNESFWAKMLLLCSIGWVGVLLFMELINRVLHKIVDCVDEMYPD